MVTKFFNYFKSPPEHENFEITQKAKFLHVTLFVIAVSCVLIGYQNRTGETHLDVLLYVLAAISLICIPILRLGYYSITAYFITTLILGVLTYSLIDGIGLTDAALIAFPIFIIFTSFLFNRQAAIITAVLSMLSVFFVYFFYQRRGYFDQKELFVEIQLIIILILLMAAGILVWAVMDSRERVMQYLRDAYDLTLAGWGKALEYHDQGTEGHSQRVTELTVELAYRLGIPNNKINTIRRGALLHDIGKMAVPDAILSKKSKLTEQEWKIIKDHPNHAMEMLEDIPFLKSALDIPCYHHERWNGTGYPDGLSMTEIPFPARIFAVVDVWDALNSDRPYRKAWDREEATAYIKEQSGILFDPQVVREFLSMISPATH